MKFFKAVRKKMMEIRDPDKDYIDNRDFEFRNKRTKKFGKIPTIVFKENSMQIKYEIMTELGYSPMIYKTGYRQRRNMASSAFDKIWDNLAFRLVKSAKLLAIFNESFTLAGQEVAEIINLTQRCIKPTNPSGHIHHEDINEGPSYLDALDEM
jgi:hypothetical protein